MRISDWSLDVCSSDLLAAEKGEHRFADVFAGDLLIENIGDRRQEAGRAAEQGVPEDARVRADLVAGERAVEGRDHRDMLQRDRKSAVEGRTVAVRVERGGSGGIERTRRMRRAGSR